MQDQIKLVSGMTLTHTHNVPGAHSDGTTSRGPRLQTMHTVDIITEESSLHVGSMVTFACISQRQADEWVAVPRVSKSKLELWHEKERGAFTHWIHSFCLIYEGDYFQFAIAFVIVSIS
jgi:hypothetical protein